MSSLNLYQRLNNVMKEVTTVFKGATVQAGKNAYKAVSHDDVASLLHKPLADNGIVVMPSIVERKLETAQVTSKYDQSVNDQFRVHLVVEVKFINIDNPSETHSVYSDGWSFDNGDKAIGKAYSYAVKYALLKAFMLESSDSEEDRPNNGEDQKTIKQHSTLKDSFKEKDEFLSQIKDYLKSMSQDSSSEQKAILLESVTGAKSWKDVERMSVEQLKYIISKFF